MDKKESTVKDEGESVSKPSMEAARLKEMERLNGDLKLRLKEMEEKYLTQEERERQRRTEWESLRAEEIKSLSASAELWEKRYREAALDRKLTEAATQTASALGLRVREPAALKGLLLSDNYPDAGLKLKAIPPETKLGAEEFSWQLELSEPDEAGKKEKRVYELEAGLSRFFHSHPWLLEAERRSGLGIPGGLNYTPPGELNERIAELKQKVFKNPSDRASRIRLTQLLAAKQRQS